MIFVDCKECGKIISLEYDSVESVEKDNDYIKCVHCGREWRVTNLFESLAHQRVESNLFDAFDSEIQRCSSHEMICKKINEWSRLKGIDGLALMEYANMRIVKGQENGDSGKDLLQRSLVKLEEDKVSIDELNKKIDDALKRKEKPVEPYVVIRDSDANLRNLYDELKNRYDELSITCKQLQEKLEFYK